MFAFYIYSTYALHGLPTLCSIKISSSAQTLFTHYSPSICILCITENLFSSLETFHYAAYAYKQLVAYKQFCMTQYFVLCLIFGRMCNSNIIFCIRAAVNIVVFHNMSHLLGWRKIMCAIFTNFRIGYDLLKYP